MPGLEQRRRAKPKLKKSWNFSRVRAATSGVDRD
jgi:hypothetical protein